MFIIKKFMAILVVFALLLSLLVPSFIFASETDKNNALIQLKLLKAGETAKGESLSKEKAALLIARLTGQEPIIIKSLSKYKNTGFKDVLGNSKYAPYIGYDIEKKIIKMKKGQSFLPKSNIGEIGFITYTLNALGYIEGTDFNTSTIYKKALSLGLVSDKKYETKKINNLNFKVEDAFRVIYNALTAKRKNSAISLIQEMVNNKLISRSIPVSLGILKDEPVTVIQQITTDDKNTITVKLNESVKAIQANNISINEVDNSGSSISPVITNQTGDTLTIKTDRQYPNKQYNLILTNIEDLDGNIIPSIYLTFSGYFKKDILNITKIIATDANNISVQFDTKVKAITDSSVTIYDTSDKNSKLTATITSQVDGTVKIKTSGQTTGKAYTLEIKDIEDANGDITPLVINTFNGFTPVEIKSEYFLISKVVPISKNIINVFFTQPINTIAELPNFYEILQDGNTIVKGNFQTIGAKRIGNSDNGISLFLKDKTMFDGAQYTIKISGDMIDIYGLKLNEGSGEAKSFVARAVENPGFSVVNVQPLDPKTLLVEYSSEVDVITAQSISNYDVTTTSGGPVGVVGAVITPDGSGKKVKLKLPTSLIKTTNYQLTIKNVSDGFKQVTIPESKYPFSGSVEDRKNLSIINVTAIDKGTLAVFFDRPLGSSTASNQAFYSISGGPVISKVLYDTKIPEMVKIFTVANDLASPSSFTLTVLGAMTDELGVTSTSSATYTFSGSSEENVKPMMYEAMIVGKDAIRVRLTEDIQSSGQNMLSSNYTIEYKDGTILKTKIASSVNLVDSKTLVLKFDALDLTKQNTLKFWSLTGYLGSDIRTSTDGFTSIAVVPGN